jgi:hypothetical protein
MFKRVLIIIAATFLLILGIGIIMILLNMPTGKEKKALAIIQSEEKELSRSFDILVVRAGFQKRATGTRDIYVPCLLVWANNNSEQVSRPVTLRAEFTGNGRPFCAAMNRIAALEPGKTLEIWLKCIDFVGFGSVARGLSLAETIKGLEYRIVVESDRASIVTTHGRLNTILF